MPDDAMTPPPVFPHSSSSTYDSGRSNTTREQQQQQQQRRDEQHQHLPRDELRHPRLQQQQHQQQQLTPPRAGNYRPGSQYSGSTQLGSAHSDEGSSPPVFGLVSKKGRSRKSGGFLLDSSLSPSSSSSPPQRLQANSGRKVKRVSETVNNRGGLGESNGGGSGRERAMRYSPRKEQDVGRSPLSREVREGGIGRQQIEEEMNPMLEPRNSQEMDGDGTGDMEAPADTDPSRRSAAIDPAQIVHMALNLSEGRRRQLGAGQLVAPPLPGGRRVTSVGSSIYPGMSMHGPHQNHGPGGSLRHYLQQQRRMPRNLSPSSSSKASSAARHVSHASGGMSTIDFDSEMQLGMFGELRLSAGTLARCEKAKQYFELAAEYRRLLDHLPPLTPNDTGTQQNNQQLGRRYNPIQYIRNRKVRARERRPLDPEAEHFSDLDSVRGWVDAVQEEAGRFRSRPHQQMLLPSYTKVSAEEDMGIKQTSSGLSGKSKTLRLDWPVQPEELIADAYWMEQDSNKSLIENRHSVRMFNNNNYTSAKIQRASLDSARQQDTKRRSMVEQTGQTSTLDQNTAEDSDTQSDRGRKRRLFLPTRSDDPASRLKKLTRNRSVSSSDQSSDDEANPQAKKRYQRLSAHDVNIGPLERRMNEILEKEGKDGDLSATSVGSPDKWGFGYTPLPRNIDEMTREDSDNGVSKDQVEQMQYEPLPPEKGLLKRPTDDTMNEPRSSIDDADTSTPNTPIMSGSSLRLGSTALQSESRKPSRVKGHRKNRLSIFRSIDHTSKIRDQEASGTAGYESETRGFREAIADKISSRHEEQPKTAGHVLHKHVHPEKQSSISSTSGVKRSDTRSSKDIGRDEKDGPSAVARFFKGGRLGDTIRHERAKSKKDIQVEDFADMAVTKTQSEGESEDETTDGKAGKTDASLSKHSNGKPSYHIDNLPSFTSTHTKDFQEGASTKGSGPGLDHIHRQQLLRKKSRSTRFDSIAPPKIDLSSILTARFDPSYLRPFSSESRFGRPGASRTSTATTTTTALEQPVQSAETMSSNISPLNSRQNPGGGGGDDDDGSAAAPFRQRHWSISNASHPAHRPLDSMTTQDLHRIRAILLSSGIKARNIARCCTLPSPGTATNTSNDDSYNSSSKTTIPTSSRRLRTFEDFQNARDHALSSLQETTTSLQHTITAFRTGPATKLDTQLNTHHERIRLSLIPQVQRCADDSDAFLVELSERYPLVLKELHERADGIIRQRRRRMRVLRRSGWLLVEWVLLGVMWWLWLVVVLGRGVWGVVRGVVGVVRWVFWL